VRLTGWYGLPAAVAMSGTFGIESSTEDFLRSGHGRYSSAQFSSDEVFLVQFKEAWPSLADRPKFCSGQN